MKDNYEACLAITLKWEGGDVNHPDDPGGKTRWGVTQARYDDYRHSKRLPPRTVFSMTKPEMLDIYKTGYWDAVKGDTLAYGVDLATWDFGVNSGPARAKSTLLASVGGTDIQTIQKICKKRLSFVRGLKIWKTFSKGWSRRVADIEARAVKMSASKLPTQSVKSILKSEGQKAADKALTTTKNARNTAGGAIASGTASAMPTDQVLSLTLLGIGACALVFVLYLIIKAQKDKDRAEAYAKVAAETQT